ncbi:hypothetical protein QFC22_006131 [Naganishia vaughanmartiniae]|uniref:Uncharacterized protein n=1 Tax=Naganishia vaughanmartiniae TaxID=1424756 RepID=A0ACC2WMN5_9TREE|nr:hypothetical protein QFC22_006131 [Naganishia vaughanmartiniae]
MSHLHEQQHTHELPISVASPLQEAAHGGPMHTGNGIGAAALPGLRSEHSHSHSSQSQEKDYEKRPYPATDDVEAAPSSAEEEGEDLYADDEPSKYAEKWNAFRDSKTFTIMRDFLMIGLLIGIWIPSVVREKTRHYWIITSIIAWFLILVILFHKSKYIPKKPFSNAISKVWGMTIARPWNMLPYIGKLGVGWGAVAVLFLGSTFGIKATDASPYKWRVVSLVGMAFMYAVCWIMSSKRRAVRAQPIILGLCMQMIFGLLVFKTGAGLAVITWLALAASDLLESGIQGGAQFFWRDFIENGYFFTNTLSAIIFFVAFATLLSYVGALTWFVQKFAWFFSKTFGISGAEAVVAAASPFIGQGENCVLVRPYVKHMTDSEIHQALTSGFATIAGSVFIAYVSLGIPPKDLLTSSLMSIPASIALSKTMMPETKKPVTMGKAAVFEHDEATDGPKPYNALHAFSEGAWFGLRVAGLIFCNVLCIVSALYAVNGVLAWVGQFWGIARSGADSLSIQLIGGYILYPFTFFVAFDQISTNFKADPLWVSERAQLICRYAVCGFGNLASAGINIGILVAMAPNKADRIIRLTPRALFTGILATLSTACVAGLLG